MSDATHLISELLPAVRAAGAQILTHYRTGVTTDKKCDGSPVTIADRESEDILLAALSKAAPIIPVISEEAASAGNIPTVSDEFFLVDPLDGTREFINERDEFTVNIGLIRNGVPVFGIIYAPALAQLYATLNHETAVAARMPADGEIPNLTPGAGCAQHLTVNTLVKGAAVTVTASRSHGSEELDVFLAKRAVKERISIGSSLKFCQIAEGVADVYPRFGTTMEWDTAAGHAIVLAAGGRVISIDGTPFRYGKADQGFRNPYFIAAGSGAPIY